MQDVICNKCMHLRCNSRNHNFDAITLSNLSTTLLKVGLTDFILLSHNLKIKTSLLYGIAMNYSAPI